MSTTNWGDRRGCGDFRYLPPAPGLSWAILGSRSVWTIHQRVRSRLILGEVTVLLGFAILLTS